MATQKALEATSKAEQATTEAIKAKEDTEKAISDAVTATQDSIATKDATEAVRANTEAVRVATELVKTETKKVRDETKILYDKVNTLKSETELVKSDTVEATQKADEATQIVKSKVVEYDDYIQQFKYRSLYDNDKTYLKNSMVLYDGSSFIALKDTLPNNFPPSFDELKDEEKNEFWHLIAQKGIDGTGAVNTVNSILPDINGNIVVDKAQRFTITGKESSSLSAKNIAIATVEPAGAKNGDIWFDISEEEL